MKRRPPCIFRQQASEVSGATSHARSPDSSPAEPMIESVSAASSAAAAVHVCAGSPGKQQLGGSFAAATQQSAPVSPLRPPVGPEGMRRGACHSVSPLTNSISLSTVLVTEADFGVSALSLGERRVSTDSDDWHLV